MTQGGLFVKQHAGLFGDGCPRRRIRAWKGACCMDLLAPWTGDRKPRIPGTYMYASKQALLAVPSYAAIKRGRILDHNPGWWLLGVGGGPTTKHGSSRLYVRASIIYICDDGDRDEDASESEVQKGNVMTSSSMLTDTWRRVSGRRFPTWSLDCSPLRPYRR